MFLVFFKEYIFIQYQDQVNFFVQFFYIVTTFWSALSVFNCGVLKFLTIILDLLIFPYNLTSFFFFCCGICSYKFMIIISSLLGCPFNHYLISPFIPINGFLLVLPFTSFVALGKSINLLFSFL